MPNSTKFPIIYVCVESNYCLLFELEYCYHSLPKLPTYKQLLGKEGIDEMIEGIVPGTTQVDDHNWRRKKLRFSVQKVGDVSALYYREKKTGDSKRPPLRVVAIEDLWGTLVDVHGQVGHGGRQRMDTHLRGHGTLYPPCHTLFLDLCSICQETKGKKSTHKIIHKPIILETVGVRGQADLVDLQLFEDNGYKFILNYQDCFSKFIIGLRPCKKSD